MAITQTRTMNNGVSIPVNGFGVFQADDKQTEEAVLWALEAGYRHIDTAKIYNNEKAVGRAVASCGIPREDIFITTKLWNQNMRDNRQADAFEESLDRLGMDYVDLYLIHWPVHNFVDSWRIMEKIYADGKARAIDPLEDADTRFESASLFTATVRNAEGRPVVFEFRRAGLSWKLAGMRLPE